MPDETPPSPQAGDLKPVETAPPIADAGDTEVISDKLSEATTTVVKNVAETITSPEAPEHIRLDEVRFFQVEDEKMIRDMTPLILKILGLQGGESFTLPDGRSIPLSGATLEEAKTNFVAALENDIAISLVLLDQKFPEKPGHGEKPHAEQFAAFLTELRQNPRYTKQLKSLRTLLFISGTATEEDRQKLRPILPEDYSIQLIQKPMKNVDLKTAVVMGLANSHVLSIEETARGLDAISKQHPAEVK